MEWIFLDFMWDGGESRACPVKSCCLTDQRGGNGIICQCIGLEIKRKKNRPPEMTRTKLYYMLLGKQTGIKSAVKISGVYTVASA